MAKRLRREGASLVASTGAPARGAAEERGLGGSLLPSPGLSPSSFSSGLVTGRVGPTGRVRGHLLEVLVLAPSAALQGVLTWHPNALRNSVVS